MRKTSYLSFRNNVKNTFSFSSKQPLYTNPEVTYENCVEHHTPLRLLSSVDEALQAVISPQSESSSKWVHHVASADHPSQCRFRLYRSPKHVEQLEQQLVGRYDVSDNDDNSPVRSWQEVEIPSVWQLHPNEFADENADVNGFPTQEQHVVNASADGPLYTNMAYPFKKKNDSGTKVPIDENPTAVYRMEFVVPDSWKTDDGELIANREMHLIFHGGGSGLKIYFNGTYVGYGQDSMTETEVVVPRALIEAKEHNIISVICYKYTDGAYLEDQDQWYFSGLFRDIQISFLNTSPAGIIDYKIKAKTPRELDSSGSAGAFTVDLTVRSAEFPEITRNDDMRLRTDSRAMSLTESKFDAISGKNARMNFGPSTKTRKASKLSDVMFDVDSVQGPSMSKLRRKTDHVVARDPSGSGVTENEGAEYSFYVMCFVFDQKQRLVSSHHLRPNEDNIKATTTPFVNTVNTTLSVPNARLWSCKDPYLYTVVFELRDRENDTCIQVESCRIGIRSVEIKNGELRLNNERLMICGVNRHEFCPYKGKVMTEELLRNDLKMIKNFNFNAVRASHYPNVHRFYELCNEYGIVVIDEANVETHGMTLAGCISILQNDKRFKEQIQARIKAMVKRTFNETCIIGWSLGNEAGSGPHLRQIVDWIRKQEGYFEDNIHMAKFSAQSRAQINNNVNSASCMRLSQKRPAESSMEIMDIGEMEEEPVQPNPGAEKSNNNELFKGRFVHYEGGTSSGDSPLMLGDGQDFYISDLICPMYFSPRKMLLTLEAENNRVKIRKSKIKAKNFNLKVEKTMGRLVQKEITERTRAKFRPFILCEYAHAMGNSSGNLHLYWKLFKSSRYKQFQGGFIWDFVDQGLALKNPYIDFTEHVEELNEQAQLSDLLKSKSWGYGGTFGPSSGTGDKNFCINGMVFPNRDPHPAMYEAKYLMQPFDFTIGVTTTDPPCFIVKISAQTHAPYIEEVLFTWQLFDETSSEPLAYDSFSYKNRKPTKDVRDRAQSDTFSFGLVKAYQAFRKLEKRYRNDGRKDNLSLKVAATLPFATNCSEEGFVVAEEMFKLVEYADPDLLIRPPMKPQELNIELVQENGILSVKTNTYTGKMNTITGQLIMLNAREQSLLEPDSGISYKFSRAPTDNDRGGSDNLFDNIFSKAARKFIPDGTSIDYYWKQNGLDEINSEVVSCRSFIGNDTIDGMNFDEPEVVPNVRIVVKERHSDFKNKSKGATRFITYTEYKFLPEKLVLNCEVVAQKSVAGSVQSFPRIGTQLRIPKSLDSCNYLGRGGFESYPDRKAGAFLKVHSETLENFNVPYIKPSESTGRADVHWVEFFSLEDTLTPLFRVSYKQSENEPQTFSKAEQNLRKDEENFMRNFEEHFSHTPLNTNVAHREEIFPGLTKYPGVQDEAADDAGNEEDGFNNLMKACRDDVFYRGDISNRPAGMAGCQMSISDYSVEELVQHPHHFELDQIDTNERPYFLIMDTAHMGLGGDTSWMPHIHKQYRIKGRIWRYSLEIEPFEENRSIFTSVKTGLQKLYKSSMDITNTLRGSMDSGAGRPASRSIASAFNLPRMISKSFSDQPSSKG